MEYLGAQELLHFSTKSGDVLALVGSEHKTTRGAKVQLALSLVSATVVLAFFPKARTKG